MKPHILIIGTGAIADHHLHGIRRTFGDSGCTISATDANPAALEAFGRKAGEAVRLYPSVEAMLAQPAGQNDVVIVATPPFTHHALAIQALRSGRHVLCEKPLATSVGQADEMFATARELGLVLMDCSVRFLDWPANRHVRELVNDGKLGRLNQLRWQHRQNRVRFGIEAQPQTTWALDRSKNGGGCLMDWGPYDFSILNEVFQPEKVEVAHAWMESPETRLSLPAGVVFDVEEAVGASLRLTRKDGSSFSVVFERSACTHGEEFSVAAIEGSAGAVRWDWLMFEPEARVWHSRDEDGKLVTATETFQNDPTLLTWVEKPIRWIFDRIAGKPCPAPSADELLFNFRCLRSLYDAASSGTSKTVTK